MNAIINNINDPSWWFSIITSTFAGFLLIKIFNHTPKIIKKTLRNLIARRQRKIKNTRRSQSLVNYQIARANSYFLVFIFICCLYLVWLISGSFLAIIKASTLSAAILSLPIYISEVAWLITDGYAKELAKARGKIA
jgi:hypothetical protein